MIVGMEQGDKASAAGLPSPRLCSLEVVVARGGGRGNVVGWP